MRTLIGVVGVVFILVVVLDAFETIVLPRRVTRRLRLTKIFYFTTWLPWSAIARRMHGKKRRESFLSFFGPLSLLALLTVWAFGLVVGFSMLHWALISKLNVPDEAVTFGTYLYMSGVTFFTLGFGDVTPLAPLGRTVTVIEAGLGFGFLAIVIGYLPVLYQSFSRREVNISLLDARAGTPPSAAELLRRHSEGEDMKELGQLLDAWELWAAELMESHLSYPVLCWFRSQHDNQSWLGSLTTVLDACALVIVGVEGTSSRQAQLTFAMARHAVVDLSQIFNASPQAPKVDRFPPAEMARLREVLLAASIPLRDGPEADNKLAELRRMYEPYVNALSEYLMMPLPPWILATTAADNWRTSAWERTPQTVTSPLQRCTRAAALTSDYVD
jgi:voltage-gated potassium channel Kch